MRYEYKYAGERCPRCPHCKEPGCEISSIDPDNPAKGRCKCGGPNCDVLRFWFEQIGSDNDATFVTWTD